MRILSERRHANRMSISADGSGSRMSISAAGRHLRLSAVSHLSQIALTSLRTFVSICLLNSSSVGCGLENLQNFSHLNSTCRCSSIFIMSSSPSPAASLDFTCSFQTMASAKSRTLAAISEDHSFSKFSWRSLE